MDRYLAGVSTLRLEPSLCTGCGTCLEVCPRAVWRLEHKKAAVADLDACIECGACRTNCAEGAIAVRKGVGCAAAIITTAIGGRDRPCC